MATASRGFRLWDYDCVGFDMDHTLVRYQLKPFLEMEYRVLVDYLVEVKGYDQQLRNMYASNVPFMARGSFFLSFYHLNLLKFQRF